MFFSLSRFLTISKLVSLGVAQAKSAFKKVTLRVLFIIVALPIISLTTTDMNEVKKRMH